MKDWHLELENRVTFIKETLKQANASGCIFGNSGGKDSALAGILCRKATKNVLGVMMPCTTKQNYSSDLDDAKALAKQFDIENILVDLTPVKDRLLNQISQPLGKSANSNIAPRLRMTTLYALALERNYLVAGTSNASESYVGYFTKFGDGASDFNPIADLTATEISEFLTYLSAPSSIIKKAPSGGLFDGQTDENEMGILYADLDRYLKTGQGDSAVIERIESMHKRTDHKRNMPRKYK